MISIGIVFCDNDYHFYDRIVRQIKERVFVKHEIIVIDNTAGNKLGNKANFAFGYNAYQFAARYKIIKMAKGEYLWFLDGDDEVLGLNRIRFNDDVISYNILSETIEDHYEDKLLTKGFFTWDFIRGVVHASLWNKLIRRSLFDNIDDYVDNPLLKVVSLEDTFYLALALKNAKSVHICSETVYKHYRGTSCALSLSPERFEMLITGFSDVLELLVKLGLDRKEILNTHLRYFSSFIAKCDDPSIALASLIKAYPDKEYWLGRYEEIINNMFSVEDFFSIKNTYIQVFGEQNIPKKWYENYYQDGRVERVYFEIEPPEYEKWKYDVSIVLLVYEGNLKYLKEFTKIIENKVHVQHEVVIVDNRNDKTIPLEYSGEAVIVNTEKNLGILDGRRAGFMACNCSYVWFVDIDDLILPVYDRNYGNSDILSFSFIDEYENRWGNESKTINKNDFFTKDTLINCGVSLWNKWYKRALLEKVYKDIPSFFSIYNEDHMVHCTALKYAEQIQCICTYNPIYAHQRQCDSITTRYYDDEKLIDRMFIGFDKQIKYMTNNFFNHADVTYENPYNAIFYLKMFESTSKELRQYFMNKLKQLFGIEFIKKAIEVAMQDAPEMNSRWVNICSKYI